MNRAERGVGGGGEKGSGKLADLRSIRWSAVEMVPVKNGEAKLKFAVLRLSPAVLCDRGYREVTFHSIGRSLLRAGSAN